MGRKREEVPGGGEMLEVEVGVSVGGAGHIKSVRFWEDG